MEIDFRVKDHGGRNIRLGHTEFIGIGFLSGDPLFNMASHTGLKKKGVKSLFKWLAKTFVKR